jgi:hypothetical protein
MGTTVTSNCRGASLPGHVRRLSGKALHRETQLGRGQLFFFCLGPGEGRNACQAKGAPGGRAARATRGVVMMVFGFFFFALFSGSQVTNYLVRVNRKLIGP